MGARLFDGLRSRVIAASAGLMIGLIFLPADAVPADTPILRNFRGFNGQE